MNHLDKLGRAEDPPGRVPVKISFAIGLLMSSLLAVFPLSAQTEEVKSGEAPAASTSPRASARADYSHLEKFSDQVDNAIDKGIAYLLEQQNGLGALSTSYPVAVTGLGGLALLGAGVEYNRGPAGEGLARAVDYLIAPQRRDIRGFIRDSGETVSRMHGHTYATLFLTQVLGSMPTQQREARVREVITISVKLIVDSQTLKGGWGYTPDDPQDEASLTVCCLQVLRAAKETGFDVPLDTIRRAVRYLKDCCEEDGSFEYSLTRGSGRTSYEITAAAVSTLDAAGEYGMEEHQLGLEYMSRVISTQKRQGKSAFFASANYPLYGNLYAGQVFHQLGGVSWKEWSDSVWPQILQKQSKDGSWESRFGDSYGTSASLLILEIPRGYLPIFDR